MKFRKLLLPTLMLVLIAAVVSAADPTPLLVTPAANGDVTGTFNFTATLTGGTWNITKNCTFSTTDDGIIGVSHDNLTTYFNYTSTTALTETASTTVTFTCYNITGGSVSDTSTGVSIDNTASTCLSTLLFTNLEYLGSTTIDASTSSDAHSGIATYGYKLTKPSGSSLSSSGTTASKEWRGDAFNEIGQFLLDVNVTDNAGLTGTCTQLTVSVRNEDDGVIVTGPGGTQTTTTTRTKQKGLGLIIGASILVLLIVIVAILLVITQTKKSKKRK